MMTTSGGLIDVGCPHHQVDFRFCVIDLSTPSRSGAICTRSLLRRSVSSVTRSTFSAEPGASSPYRDNRNDWQYPVTSHP
jgi:hypothetical protein